MQVNGRLQRYPLLRIALFLIIGIMVGDACYPAVGTAVWLGKGENLAALVMGLLGDAPRLAAMREAALLASRPAAAQEIAQFLQTASAGIG